MQPARSVSKVVSKDREPDCDLVQLIVREVIMQTTPFAKIQSGAYTDATLPRPKTHRMLDRLINGVLTGVIGVGLLSLYLPIFAGGVYIRNAVYDFGTVKAGEIVSQTFVVQNLHPWPIRVTDVKAGCGCTTPFPGKRVPFTLFPLQTTSLHVTINTAEKHGDVNQPVTVTSSDQFSRGFMETVVALRAFVR